jgi:hypothetical protein
MQEQKKCAEPEEVTPNAAIIRHAIHDRACLSATHATFRLRFAPHALARDRRGRHVVIVFEYGGLTTGRAHWMWFEVDRLHRLQRTEDLWRSGPPEKRPPFDLTEIEAAVDASWVANHQPPARASEAGQPPSS